MPSNILNLEGFEVSNVQQNDRDYLITATYEPEPEVCPRCGTYEPKLYKHGTQRQQIMDVPHHGKRTMILFDRQRYKCRECARTFNQTIDAIDSARSMTTRLVDYIERRSLEETFATVSRQIGISEGTVRNIFNEWYEAENEAYNPKEPRVIGIDEVQVLGKARRIITNIEARTVIGLLRDRRKDTVVRRIYQLSGTQQQVRIVVMDMWRGYHSAVRKVYPTADIVVDKFHIVRMATDVLEQVRRSYKNNLTPKRRKGLKRDRWIKP